MANNFGIGFVSTLTAHLNNALAQVQQQQALEQERKRNLANLMIQSGMSQGGDEGARMMAAGWTVLLDPKAKIEEPEKSKAWQQAAGIAHLTTQMPTSGQGASQAPPPTIGKPPTPGNVPESAPDLSSILAQTSSSQSSSQPPPGPPGALPSTSPTTGGPALNLTPGATAAPSPAPPTATPPPGAVTPGPAAAGPAPPPGAQPDPGWDAMKQHVAKLVDAARAGHAPNSSQDIINKKAGDMIAMINAYQAAGQPMTDEKIQEILTAVNPTAFKIEATKDAATTRNNQAVKMQQMKQQGAMALEAAKEAFKKGAAQVELDDDQAQALGLPQAGFIDARVMAQLEANHRASIAAGARVRAASTSAGTGIVKVVDSDGNTVYALKSDAVGKAAPLGGGMETVVSRAEAGLQASAEIRQRLKDPKVKAGLGAIAGRVATMGQFIGGDAVPPELTELSTAMKGYILAAYGVHGLRNAKEANHDYEHFLSLKFSPANLSAALDGYDVILKGFAAHRPTGKVSPPPGATKPKADPLGLFQ